MLNNSPALSLLDAMEEPALLAGAERLQIGCGKRVKRLHGSPHRLS